MSRNKLIRETEHRVRASKAYADWVSRNKSHSCVTCDSSDDLEHHHIIDLYHILLGLYKFYGDWESTFKHAVAMHESDLTEGVTLCSTCHEKRHPGRIISNQDAPDPESVHLWTVTPRTLAAPFSQRQERQPDSICLIDFQLLFATGWYVLNKQCRSRIIQTTSSKLAKLLKKQNGTSWRASLTRSAESLRQIGYINAYHIDPNKNAELHVSHEYLDALNEQPWFFPLEEVPSPNMLALTLKWFLSCVSNRSRYAIGIHKLAGHLGANDRMDKFGKRVIEACGPIRWVNCRIDARQIARFTLRKRGAVPVHSMRLLLKEAIKESR